MKNENHIYEDEYGNRLYGKKITKKDEPGVQFYAKTPDGKLVNEEGLAELMKESGVLGDYEIKPDLQRGKRMMPDLRPPDYWKIRR